MAGKAYPGIFVPELSTGYLNIGAVQKTRANDAKGFPGELVPGLSEGFINIGAVQAGAAGVAGASLIWAPYRHMNTAILIR